jgi:diguanylate cyclase (GGDEF)-like protein
MLCVQVAIASSVDDIVRLRNAGKLALAEQEASALLQSAISDANPKLKADALYEMALNAMERNNYPLAHQHLSQANSIYQDLGDELSMANTYRQIGLTHRFQSNYVTALEYLYTAFAIYQSEGSAQDKASINSSIGLVLEKMGQFNEAAYYHQQSLETNYALDDSSGIASDLYNLADLRRLLGDYALALDYFKQALVIDEASGNKKNIAYSCYKIGYVNMNMGNYILAEQYMRRAHSLFIEIGAKRDIDWALTGLSDLALKLGKISDAESSINGVILRAEKNGYKSLLVDAYQTLIEIKIEQEQYDKALGLIEGAIALAESMEELHHVSQLLALQVNVLEALDDVNNAFVALKRQKQLDESLFDQRRLNALASTQAQTEFIRRANQITLLEQQQALQKVKSANEREHRRHLLFGFMLLLLIAFLFYARRVQSRYTQKLKREVKARTLQLQRANEELSALSLTDKLTGLRNRRFIESNIDADISSVVRKHRQAPHHSGLTEADLCLFVIDLDYFKQINDSFGHAAGDRVLQQTATRLTSIFRESDYVVRWGGEEFVAVARFIDREHAMNLASRIVEDIQNIPFMLTEEVNQTVTCSVGFACFPFHQHNESKHDFSELFTAADHCLYAAKAAGRNQWIGVTNILEAAALPLPTTLAELAALSKQNLIAMASST